MAIVPPITKSTSYLLAFSVLLIGLGIYSLLRPLILSNDSIYGFLAYNGTLQSGSFNVVTRVSASNINLIEKHFVAWWSPGQWLFPGLLTYLFGFKFGISSILVTVIFACLGMLGYSKVFAYFKFPLPLQLLCLIIILSSSTFYYSFIIYQGGEILEFGVFPWFLLYVLNIKKINLFSLALLTGAFLLCFLAKITLALYCAVIILFKIFQIVVNQFSAIKKPAIPKNTLLLLIPTLICLAIIYFFFLSRGIRIQAYSRPSFSPEAILVPLSSPLISILSIQQWISRIGKIISLREGGTPISYLFSILLYLCSCLSTILIGQAIYRNKKIDTSYKQLLLFIYVCVCCAFMLLYLLGATISLSSRHFKLLGYLFIPGLLSVLQARLKSSTLNVTVLSFLIIAIMDFYYLKQKWTANRYISINHFYRNFDNLDKIDALDLTSYQQLLDMDRSNNYDSQSIFFIESNDDIGIDMRHQCISQRPDNSYFQMPYLGKGPTVIICISKHTLTQYPDFLKRKFPGYCNFESISETTKYLFFVAKPSAICIRMHSD